MRCHQLVFPAVKNVIPCREKKKFPAVQIEIPCREKRKPHGRKKNFHSRKLGIFDAQNRKYNYELYSTRY